MSEFWLLTSLIVLFATIQSLFGIGLLVFGTPTLLLLGHPFDVTLGLLLPSSIAISTTQFFSGRAGVQLLKRQILVYSVPSIVIGLAVVLKGILVIDIKFAVGIVLFATAIIRHVEGIRVRVANLLKKKSRIYLVVMGLVHGVSNMGGGLLTTFVSTVFQDKETIRANIAYGYLVFALSQVIVLLALHPAVFTVQSLGFAVISFVTYFTIGNTIFLNSSTEVYQHMLTAFIFVFGAILVGSSMDVVSSWIGCCRS
ncbi:MAG: hypothetical protein OEU36_10730 [Gammaproteobacteria bacterium]|nr:hypothetical protein [Gammaproteobacteria bacterium]